MGLLGPKPAVRPQYSRMEGFLPLHSRHVRAGRVRPRHGWGLGVKGGIIGGMVGKWGFGRASPGALLTSSSRLQAPGTA